ncbi:photosystem II oxygen evolving complex protein PsbU [Rippkaea orientalis PCC 8801]|uniref:Photosystem II extrinsic protein U n=1 Tax=Rippkaea orientalis (strain PCC 8801 / RF-1) TaxID=41431 RepID=B7K471_RIPO1|nr:photosystem II complex extrinsic protein PsbU [Rippkaea orientalis]ACK67777.1 photosystem II oxygen evolving complex protein PsbU [Rippkaea orientalis PCC 8801]
MKTLVRIVAVLLLVISCFGFTGQVLAAENLNPVDAKLTTEYGQKIDLNNAHIRKFRDLKGFYPNLASKIILNSPYENVEDVLEIPGLSESQKQRLEANLDKFVVTPPSAELIEGDDRLNPGVY